MTPYQKTLILIKRSWQFAPYALFSIIPGIDNPDFVTQIRPGAGTNSQEQLNTTLNSFWDKFFGTTGIVYMILGGLALIILINAGMRYIAAGNNPEATKKARAMILHTILAILLIVCAYTIIRLMISIGSFFQGKVAGG